MKYFLDLEETVIDSWQSGRLVNVNKLKTLNMSEVTIFSFAVWNAQDIAHFDKQLRSMIELAVNVKVVKCPTVQDMMEADTKFTGVHWHGDVTEFITLRGKFNAFVHWSNLMHPTDDCMLVDDIVPNVDIVNRDTGRKLAFLNVNSIT